MGSIELKSTFTRGPFTLQGLSTAFVQIPVGVESGSFDVMFEFKIARPRLDGAPTDDVPTWFVSFELEQLGDWYAMRVIKKGWES